MILPGRRGPAGFVDSTPVTYLDHAATTPVRPEVAEAVAQGLKRTGNPSSLHTAGRAARRVVEESRELIAERLGARPSEVVLTAGGTEADNLAVLGVTRARRAQDPGRRRVVVSAVEHHAVLDPARWLADREGGALTLVPVDGEGRVDLTALDRALGDDVALVSVLWVNNEIGTVQPVGEVVRAAHRAGVPVHSDAVQAVGRVPVHLTDSGLDAITLSGHKIGAPVGTGALLARRDLPIEAVLHGGGQERGVRSGTVDAVGARALAVAVDLAVTELAEEAARLRGLQELLVDGIRRAVPDAVLRGPAPGPGRSPANVHLTFPGCEGDSLLYLLDSRGVCCSTGSACQAGVPQPSHVVLAVGADERAARGALRFSLGRTSTAADVEAVLTVLPEVVERARAAGLTGVA